MIYSTPNQVSKVKIMTHKLLILPGDGIGPEVVDAAIQVLNSLERVTGTTYEKEFALVGGAAFEDSGNPLP